MSDQLLRYAIPRKDADLIRRAIGAALRPQKSMKELADESGANYDVLRDFLRSRSSSFRTVEDRECVRRCAELCLAMLGFNALSDAEGLPPYAPRRTPAKDTVAAAIRARLTHRIHALLKNIPEKQLTDAVGLLKGMFICYRVLSGKAVRSKVYIYRYDRALWLEFTEVWMREGDRVEYNGYIFPTTEFLYFFGTHRKYGVPRTIVGRTSWKKGQPLQIIGIVTGHSPTRGVVVSSPILMEKVASDFKGKQDFRRRVTLDDTGDIDLSDLTEPVAFSLSQGQQGLVSIHSDQL